MKGILILAHGSRETETESTLKEIVSMLQARNDGYVIETAFLQFSKVKLADGLDKLREQKIQDIIVIPYFLFDGVHIREDIPGEIREYVEEHPEVKISMGKTLGADPRLAAILADRIAEAV